MLTEETIKALAEDHVKTFWYEQAENIQRKIEMAFKAGYKAALSGTERVECYLPVSVEDRSEPMPKDGNCYLLFDNGEIRHFFQDDLPFNSVTHWLKKTTVRVVHNHQ